MILFQSSLFLFLLGNLFQNLPPQKINSYFGFRTKKSMKNQKNWEISQREIAIQLKKIFSYTCLYSTSLLILDIFLIILNKDTTLTFSIISQGIILSVLLLKAYIKTNKKLN